jgi:hypothetical protein
MNRLLVVIALLVIPSASRAQSVPLIAVDFTAGDGGPATLQTTHTYYGLGRPNLLRAAATLRVGTSGSIRPVITAEYSASCPLACGDKAVCVIAPIGGCSQHLADLEGAAVAAGIAGRVGGLLLVQATGGVAEYWDRARYLDFTAVFSPVSHFAVVADIRHIAGHDARGDNVWYFPRSFGVRVY